MATTIKSKEKSMKRISRILTALVIGLIPLVVSSSTFAQAASTCQIGFTGPDSNNMCTSTTTYTCEVTNNNNVTITNSNGQTAASGQVTTSGNGQGGNSTSGTVTNSNGTVFNVTITNAGEDSQGTCVATQTVPATPPPTTSVQPTVTPAATTPAASPATLPHTSGDMSGTILAIIVMVLGAGAVATTATALVYRHIKS